VRSLLEDVENQPIGVLFLLCYLVRRAKSSFTQQLPRLLRVCWRTQVYYLRLEALEAVQDHPHEMEEPIRSELVALIQGLDWEGHLGLSTAIIEALASYDALEVGVTVDDAAKEIDGLLKEPQDSKNEDRAYTIYTNMFEDVFQGVYYHAIYDLTPEARARFLTMAALGAPDYSFFADNILRELVELDDPIAMEAFQKWGVIPKAESHSIHDAVSAFVWGIVGLSRYVDEPPSLNRPMKNDEAAWQTYREILFWLYKPLITERAVQERCSPCWQRLQSIYSTAAVDPLFHINKGIESGNQVTKAKLINPIDAFPKDVKIILEQGVKRLSELSSLFTSGIYARIERDKFIVDTLSKVGDESTVPILEEVIDSPELGTDAAKAIRRIRTRQF